MYFTFLKQACTGLWLARVWFLRIALSANVGIHVCVCAPVCPAPGLLITTGVMCYYMAAVVDNVSGRGLSIHTYPRN